MTFLIHLAIGCAGLAAGRLGGKVCPHKNHQRIVTGVILLGEATFVTLLGA